MAANEHDRFSDDLGAFLLGALSDDETRAIKRHLDQCEDCREELTHLRPAADSLLHAVEQYVPPPSLKQALMTTVEAEARTTERAERKSRPRRESLLARLLPVRPRVALAGAAAVLVIGAAVGIALDRATRGGNGMRVLAATIDRRALPAGAAQLDIPRHGHATLRVSGLPVLRGNRVYEVWVQRNGAVRPAGALFAVMRNGNGAAAIPAGLRGVQAVMVTRERAGGASRPTEAPVISVRT